MKNEKKIENISFGLSIWAILILTYSFYIVFGLGPALYACAWSFAAAGFSYISGRFHQLKFHAVTPQSLGLVPAPGYACSTPSPYPIDLYKLSPEKETEAIIKVEKLTKDIFGNCQIRKERDYDEYDVLDGYYYVANAVDNGEVDEIVKRHHEWHKSLSCLSPEERRMFRLSVDARD